MLIKLGCTGEAVPRSTCTTNNNAKTTMQVHHGQQAEKVKTHHEYEKHFRRPPARLLSYLLACLLVFICTYVQNLLAVFLTHVLTVLIQ